MALMQWDGTYSVKVSQFDTQHKKLVGMLNDLHSAMKEGKSKEIMGKTLDDLIAYTVTHFADEERLMKQHGYPEYDAHKAEHDKLTQQALKLQSEFKAGKAGVNMEVLNFLRDWLKNHIMGTDKKYGPFLNTKGVS